jgi:hypothetical protein
MAQFPAGTYIYSDAIIPSGWNNQTGYNGRYVLGATSPSQVKTQGGATSHKHDGISLLAGGVHNHGGSQALTILGANGSNVIGTATASAAAGGHTHTASVTISNNLSHSHTVGETSPADNSIPHTVLMLLRKS